MIRFEGVSKRFPGEDGAPRTAVEDLNLAVPSGTSLCLIGPSGCGKTTTLRLVNRLLEPDTGRVRVAGTDVADADPIRLRRDTGYVVQRGGLFPHLTVRANVGLLGRIEEWQPARLRARVDDLLVRVNLDPREFGPRYPHELSGGQAQRVGVARALLLDPPVVLLDEPFGALDPVTRRELQREFLALRAGSDTTLLIVTHDLEEAFRLGDQVALLDAGRLVQVGQREDFESRPASPWVERFLEAQLG